MRSQKLFLMVNTKLTSLPGCNNKNVQLILFECLNMKEVTHEGL